MMSMLLKSRELMIYDINERFNMLVIYLIKKNNFDNNRGLSFYYCLIVIDKF